MVFDLYFGDFELEPFGFQVVYCVLNQSSVKLGMRKTWRRRRRLNTGSFLNIEGRTVC